MEQTLQHLTHQIPITFFLSLASFLLAMFLTPLYTFIAYRYKFWKKQRSTSSTGEKLVVFTKLHANKFKRNIPTMAGIIFVISITVVTLSFDSSRDFTWLPLAALLGGAIVGILDDIINIRGQGQGVAGLRSSIKFSMITLIGLGIGTYFYYKLGINQVYVPFVGPWTLGWVMIPIIAFVIVATGNAVNITDGLDGLAGGLAATAFGSFGIIAILEGKIGLASFCFIVVGALLSYIWFNIFPARFFMGDVGSFALGTSLGVVAIETNCLILLPVIGLLFVIEAGSSLIQIFSKKVFKKKIFLSAPIHHHLEASGWPETKVTMRFWVIGFVTGFVGIFIAITGGHI